MSVCVYCTKARGDETDHLITKNAARSRHLWKEREFDRFKVRACHGCNGSKFTFCRVPPGYEHLIPELEELTKRSYEVWP